MDYYAELVYGFDFSDDNYPKTKFKLSKDIIEQLRDEDLITTIYSGFGDEPSYLGESLVKYNSGDNMFNAVEEFNKKITNKKFYDIAINMKIDGILYWLGEEGDERVEDGDFSLQDLQEAKKYFNDLKNHTPSNITISGTD